MARYDRLFLQRDPLTLQFWRAKDRRHEAYRPALPGLSSDRAIFFWDKAHGRGSKSSRRLFRLIAGRRSIPSASNGRIETAGLISYRRERAMSAATRVSLA